MFSIQAHSDWVNSAQFSPDTRLIATGSKDSSVRLWDVTTKDMLGDFKCHETQSKDLMGVNSVKFHPDGTCVASGGQDSKMKIWDIRSQRLIQHYDAHNAAVNEVSFHASGRYLLSASADSTIKVWDLRQGYILYTLYGHEGPSNTADFSPNGDYFCSSGNDSVVMVWKSNLNEDDVELIDDLGNKTANSMGAPKARIQPPAAEPPKVKLPTKRLTSPLRTGPRVSQARGDFETVCGQSAPSVMTKEYEESLVSAAVIPPPMIVNDGGVAGTGDELTNTLNKIVSQLSIITGTL